MTTITIKNGKNLSQSVFDTFDDFIEAYYIAQGKVVLRSLHESDLSDEELAAYQQHKADGYDDFEDIAI